MKKHEEKIKEILRKWELAIDRNILLIIPVCILIGILFGIWL